jgi:hypothetical protein
MLAQERLREQAPQPAKFEGEPKMQCRRKTGSVEEPKAENSELLYFDRPI